MGPIELLYLSIGIIFVFVALARGYNRELGVTIIALTAIFVLTLFEERIDSVMTRILTDFIGITNPLVINFWVALLFTVLFVFVIFASYAGQVLFIFPGQPAPAPWGTFLSLMVGLVNAYLISGTLWYFQDQYQYPLKLIVLIEDWRLSEAAVALTAYLPPRLFDNPAYWIIPVAVLLFMRVRG